MAHFAEFDAYLNQPYSDNYWYDDAVLHAHELVQMLTPADWAVLAQTWRLRPSTWQYRCAQVLPWGNVAYAVPLLVDMLQTRDDALTIEAVDSLRDLAPEVVAAKITPAIADRLQVVAQRHGGITARVIDVLLAKTRSQD